MADPTDDYTSQLAAIQQQLALAQRMQQSPDQTNLIQAGGRVVPNYGGAFTSAVRQVKSNSDVKRLSEQQAQLQQAILDHARQNATNGMVQLTHNDTDQINSVDGEPPTPLAPGHLAPDPQGQQNATDQATAYSMMDPLSAQKDIAQRLLDRANPQPYNLAADTTRFVNDRPVATGLGRSSSAAPDRELVKVIDKTKPEGYRTILRSQFNPATDNEWVPPKTGAADAASSALTPDTIHDAVIDVMADPNRLRQYASYGQSGQVNRNLINNEKAKTLRDIGMTEQEVIRQQAIAKGQAKSMSDLVGMQNAVGAYETVAQGNGQRVLELVHKVNTAGIPVLNSAKRLGEQQAGSPDAAELMQVLQNYQTEVARIIANPRLVGQLTDTARKEIETAIPANMTPAQAERIVKRLNFEFELRNKGIQNQIDTAGSQLTPGFPTTPPPAQSPGLPQATAAPSPAGGPVRISTDQEYAALPSGTPFIGPDGKTRKKP